MRPHCTPTDFLELVLPVRINTSCCHLVATVCAPNKTLADDPQGYPGAVATLEPPVDERFFYFGEVRRRENVARRVGWRGTGALRPFTCVMPAFSQFNLTGWTNPFERGLNATSKDGGVLVANVPLGVYVMRASAPGVVFDDPPTAIFTCTTPNMFINAAPPYGPRVGVSYYLE